MEFVREIRNLIDTDGNKTLRELPTTHRLD